MITRLLPLFVVGIVVALAGTGCSVRDSGRNVAVEPGQETDAWSASALAGQRLSRDAGLALRRSGMKPANAPDIWTRARLGFSFTDELHHPRVQRYIHHYRQRPNVIRVSSARAEPFAYFILTEIERRGLPSELLLLPIVESGYAPEATSRSSAAGIWQFIPSTGEHFGLIQDTWYDGRRDVYQSTFAALDYLERLHARFGDWYLALAAYNFGQGNLARAIAANASAGKPTDYWSLKLSAEAMEYVPRLLALRALFDDPDHFGISLPVIANRPVLETVQMGRQADLVYVAELARIDSREVLRLNPGYRRAVTHPHAAQHVLLPADAAKRLQTALSRQEPGAPLLRNREYQVRPGDNLGQIARSHGVSVAAIRSANGLSGDTIRAGQTLRIPLYSQQAGSGSASAGAATTARAPATAPAATAAAATAMPSAFREYTVRSGDTLWAISRHNAVDIAELRRHNNLAADATLRPGQVLRLPPDVSANGVRRLEYVIRPGDSLGAISRRFQVAVSDLQRWNSLNGHQIRAGDTLTLYVAANLPQDG